MKLLKLEVQGYKNLKDIKIDFTKSGHCSLIIGTNGSGKSNLLEVFSAIFYALYNGDTNVKNDFSFTLEYVIERMRTGSAGGGPLYEFPVWVKLQNSNGIVGMEIHDANNTDWGFVDKKDYDMFLPEHVVAVYSGEEKRLWEDYYFKAYDDFNKQYLKSVPRTPQRLLYINKYYWDLVASILAIYEDPACEEFLDHIGLHIESVECKFDTTKMANNKNAMASEMLEILNPDKKEEVCLTIDKIKQLQNVCGYESDVFYNLLVLVLYKQYKIITDYRIKCKDGISIRNLSEGEKKMLLIYGATYIIGGENLYLFDEPDAHIHEGRKKDIFEQLIYSGENQYVITSHSPTMTTIFPNNSLIVLTSENNEVKVLDENRKKAISMLTDGIWCAEAQSILLESGKDLLLVEGKGDTKYINKAIEYFKSIDEKYEALDLFILPFGGTGNCKDFIDNVITSGKITRKIIALFDADDSGRDKFSKLTKRNGKEYTSKIYDINKQTKALLLPKPSDNRNNEFMIEDYFDDFSGFEAEKEEEYAKCNGVKEKSSFKYSAKDYIAKHCDDIGYKGFQILLDKLLNILSTWE